VTERNTGKAVYGTRPYAILARGGLRIGIIGVTSSHPGAAAAEKVYRFTDEFKAAKAAYANVSPEVDAVIALTHIGFADDLVLADILPDLIAIVGGHSHTLLTKPFARGPVPVAQSGSEGAYLGRLTLSLKKSGARWKLDSYDGDLLVVDDYSPDARVLAVVNGYLKTLPKKKR
jgi:5'-nucleotidase